LTQTMSRLPPIVPWRIKTTGLSIEVDSPARETEGGQSPPFSRCRLNNRPAQ
jgi:hypothetical protein